MPSCLSFSVQTQSYVIVQEDIPKRGTTNFQSCAFVIDTGTEYVARQNAIAAAGSSAATSYPAWNELGSLSIADAQVITGYVGLLWAGVWGVKQIVKMLSSSERNQDE